MAPLQSPPSSWPGLIFLSREHHNAASSSSSSPVPLSSPLPSPCFSSRGAQTSSTQSGSLIPYHRAVPPDQLGATTTAALSRRPALLCCQPSH
ncbi:hypothetical protein M0R45_001691 [Rubus argutus]|uniref:Uncharacterized protein n=1 Tax=Rubus argutus TaxID=59490 RepID=A0AAW1VL35_RUBAR